MEFGLKDILYGIAGISMIIWVAVIGLWHTYMFPRFFREDSFNRNVSADTKSASNAGNSFQGGLKPWFVNDEGETLNPGSGLTAIGLEDRSKYTKRSFVVADFNPIDSNYSVNRLYTTILIGLAISSFVLITHGLQSGFGLIGANL